MKEKPPFSKNEKCFNFFKMDKKNVQIYISQILYGKSGSCDDKKILASHDKKKFFKFVTINFYKKMGGIFLLTALVNNR